MKKFIVFITCLTFLFQVNAQTPPSASTEVQATVELWASRPTFSDGTINIWNERVKDEEYVAFQIRADIDIYQFLLSKYQAERLIDAIKNYLLVVRQSKNNTSDATGWLYKTDVKFRRLAQKSIDEELIVNIERKKGKKPNLVLTFNSWLLSFGGPDSPSDRTYKSINLDPTFAASLQRAIGEAVKAIKTPDENP